MALSPSAARTAFLSLAAVAGLALVVALLAILLAWDAAPAILVAALVVLAAVVVAEVVLILVSRPRNA